MPEPLHVQADLVLPAGLEAQFDEGCPEEPLAHAEVRHRPASFRLVADLQTFAVRVNARYRCFDGPAIVQWDTFDDREIPALEAMSPEQLAPGRMCLARQGQRERTGRIAIEPMQHPGIAVPAVEVPRVVLRAPEHRV